MQFFHRPAVVHKIARQPIEHCRMSRRLCASAEIARRSNESCAEVMKPQAIHKDPCRQWILLAGDGFGQFEPSAAFGKGLPLLACEDFQELFWDFFALVD